MKSGYTGIVLAGGESKRMGRDKRQLMVEGQTLLARTIAQLRPLVVELLVVVRDLDQIPSVEARIVTDQYPGRGVLAGVHAGLAAARTSWAYLVAGDMPLLDAALLRSMAALPEEDCDIVVPCWQGELEPLHALYRPNICAPAAETALQQGKRRIIAFYPQVRVCELNENFIAQHDPEGRSFFNVNRWEQWRWLHDSLKNGATSIRD